jgi:hypothetical protein
MTRTATSVIGVLAVLAMTVACAGDAGDASGKLEVTSQASVLPSIGPSTFRDAIVSAPSPGPYRADGLLYRAASSLPTDVQPPQVRASVTITNESDRENVLRLKGCSLLLRAYRSPKRAGTPAFFEAERPGWECTEQGKEVALAPGASRELTTEVDAYRILDDSNPEGRYYFTVLLRREDHALELPAGDAQLGYGLGALRHRAETRLADEGRMLDVEVIVRNAGGQPVHVEYGACAIRLRVYRAPDRAGEPVWDSFRRPNPDPRTGEVRACPTHSAAQSLAPGDSLVPSEFSESIPVAAILGDSLADGDYYFAASIKMNHHFLEDVNAGKAELKALK